MNIQESNLHFKPLTKRVKTNFIILHHRAGVGSIQQMHLQHIKQGWAGVGYHYYVRKNGEIWRGRPQWAVGSHCIGRNSDSIGVCFEGNFEVEKMGEVQLTAGLELIKYLKEKVYPQALVDGHREHSATACPGREFLMGRFKGE